MLGEPPDVARSLLLGLDGVPAEAEVLVGFPDSIWEPEDGFVRLLDVLRDGAHDVVLGLFRASEPERSDVVALRADGIVTRVRVKPADPGSDLVWGCCAARAGALAGLRAHAEPGMLFAALATRRRVAGIELSDAWIDIGTPAALRQAGG